MKLTSISQFALKLRLGCRQLGWSNALAILLCLSGSIAWLWAVPYLKQQRMISQTKLQQTQVTVNQLPKATSAVELTQSEQRLRAFYSALGETHYVEQQVASLIGLATKNGLILNQAEYKLAQNKNGHFHTYTVTMPVKGQYSMIRGFCDQVLLSIPFAALDELNFKRASISNQIIETRIRFTLYLDDVSEPENNSLASSVKQGELQ
ncbi:hypothetical protein [Solimicrobium silvestre]|uniref:Pilus assembly protein, PilO n=1 Tax=Solimicrobium silvestre TaxID=2099400 RepID=A0A2S9GY96_9BURK|nr:hypothetical protein [Solimicrobium silvestre]PRC92697.1 hypothetical protein S2091_2752 [Solimicrobium silvestre]